MITKESKTVAFVERDYAKAELKIVVIQDDLAKLDGRKPYNRPMTKAEYGDEVTTSSLEKKYGMPIETLRQIVGPGRGYVR